MGGKRYLQCICLLSYPELSVNSPDYIGVIDGCAEVTSHLLTILGGGGGEWIVNGLQ